MQIMRHLAIAAPRTPIQRRLVVNKSEVPVLTRCSITFVWRNYSLTNLSLRGSIIGPSNSPTLQKEGVYRAVQNRRRTSC